MTPNDVVKVLIGLGDTQRQVQDEISELDEASVRARAKYDTANARVFLQSDGPVDVRKSKALIETRDEKLEAELAAVRHRAAVNYERYLKNQIDTHRTISATVRSEWEHTK
jgi:hypothetical protein|tara:strand:- start:184 stop:516 length:333 start_codon:yes stop_codon:yes gene_type:complete